MSLSADGQTIHCDGAGCDAAVRAPVALRSAPAPTVDGWLFVASRDRWSHYCPRCVRPYLRALASGAPLREGV